MKFGDKVKVSDRLWKELISAINSVHHSKIKNCFIYVVGGEDISLISLTDELIPVFASTPSNKITKNWELYIYWVDYKSTSGTFSFINFCDSHKYGKSNPVGPNYRDIIQTPTFTIDNIPTSEIFPLAEQFKKLAQSSGGKCLICKDFNPYMNQDGFCWSCNSDPRNKYKIEEILVKMASV